MRRLLLLCLISVSSLSMVGCGFINGLLGRDDGASPPDGDSSLDGVPLPAASEDEEPEVEPILPAASGAAAIAAAELIQSTNPDERASRVSSSRTDPFATVVPATPVVLEPPEPPPGTNNNNNGGRQQPPAATGRPGAVSPIQPLPQLPRPDLAEAVAVTGVVQIGNTPHAIVQAPGEPTSRYVTAGQRLSNGQVLVKRIEIREGLEPRVIFEQNGIEVAVTVGTNVETASAVVPAASSVSDTSAALPTPTLTNGGLPELPPAPPL
ncbi:MAG: hypothetical protein AAF728_02005 [Cyanobacteria bacterium P01_D01_bin.128]